MVSELDDSEKVATQKLRHDGWWASKAFSPALQVHGPALPPVDHPDAVLMWQRVSPPAPQ